MPKRKDLPTDSSDSEDAAPQGPAPRKARRVNPPDETNEERLSE